MNTILIAYQNRPEHLRLLADSLGFNDDLANHNLLVVDQGSTVPPTDVLAGCRIPWRVIEAALPGTFWKTRLLNIGIEAANTEWVTVMDADCVAPPNWLDYLKTCLDIADPKSKFAHQVLQLPEPLTRHIQINGIQGFHEVLKEGAYFLEAYYFHYAGLPTGNSQFTTRKSILKEAGCYDEHYRDYGYEDHDLNLKLYTKAITQQSPIPLYHLYHESRRNLRDRGQRAMFEYFASKWPEASAQERRGLPF